jgi:uncharacterized protein (TIGR00299 family) protein
MPHGADHEHGAGHGHGHGHGHSEREPLAGHAGTGKILFFDAPSGLAGDMIVGAVLDLGVPVSVIEEALGALDLGGYHLHLGTREQCGVFAAKFDVHVDAQQPARDWATIRTMLATSRLDDATRTTAVRIFEHLAQAEAKVHRTSVNEVHFHEVGGVDSIVDIVSAAAGLTYLGAEVWVSPLPMGRGFIRAAHGVLPLPAPATVECLKGFETYDGGLPFEFVTPTGAAIVGAMARGSKGWPHFSPARVGWGAGTAAIADRPNLLRAILGDVAPQCAASDHVVIETNLDDATGELIAHAIEQLLRAGALDAWATPITMKKGRPAVTVSAIAEAPRADAIAATLLSETTSLGVRRYGVSRMERPRRNIELVTKFGTISVKVSEGPFGPPQVKPEFDDCVRAATAHQVTVREVMAAALEAFTSP